MEADGANPQSGRLIAQEGFFSQKLSIQRDAVRLINAGQITKEIGHAENHVTFMV